MPIKEYILNAQGTQSGPHSFIGGGARFVYSPDEDRLVCVGPLFESLELLVSETLRITAEPPRAGTSNLGAEAVLLVKYWKQRLRMKELPQKCVGTCMQGW